MDFKSARVLVTGGAGFVGSNLARMRTLGFRPKVTLKTGLKRFIDSYNDSRSPK
jgi:nucleoside-diphosphate-sugar epimerase